MLSKYQNIYFLGIGGIGMSSLAQYFVHEKKNVGGYDKVESEITQNLEKINVPINYEDNVTSIPVEFLDRDKTLVIFTPAIPKLNKQFVHFKLNNFKILKRSEILGLISKNKFCIAIAGTHGKTTTSSILSHILFDNNIKFTSFVGGISENYNTNFIQNGNEIILVEADEFDRSFLTLNPNIACITSIDLDHLDIYENEIQLKNSFIDFTKRIKKDGILLVNENVSINGITFGFENDSNYYISDYKIINNVSTFNINSKEHVFEVNFDMPGKHNALNALAAFVVGLKLKIQPEKIISSILTFKGVKRRFSFISKYPKIIIDDYAHHPIEIKAIRESIRDLYPNKKVTAVFQPHLYSRTKDLMDEFASSLSDFDEVILTDIYPAREKPIKNVNSNILLSKINNINKHLTDKSNLSSHLSRSDSEVLVIMGAGDISNEVEKIKKTIEQL